MSKPPRSCSLLIVLALTVAALPLEAKTGGRLSGKIKNVSGEGVFGAVITILKPDEGGGSIFFTRSDKSGSYNLANVTPGSYYIQVSRDGYEPLTSSNVKIDAGKTTGLDIILQEFFGLISNDSDPRNWDIKALMRSASGRRLIFRDQPGVLLPGVETDAPFYRSGTMNVSSNASLNSQNQSVFPSKGRNGVVSNFAFIEPVSQHTRVIFSGQLNSGYDSFWRVRNTYDYRPDDSRDFRFSAGYGRLNLSRPTLGELGRPAQFFNEDPALHESAVETLVLGLEGSNKFLDIMQVGYGFDYSRLSYGQIRGVFSPYVQFSISPGRGWVFKSSLSSKRLEDENTLLLPDGEQLNLSEPTYITRIGNQTTMSQFKHSELALVKGLSDDTSVEVAAYEDRSDGPGLPFLVTIHRPSGTDSQLAQLGADQCRQRGLRFVMDRKLFDYLSGSIAYVYGTGTGLADTSTPLSSDQLARNLLSYMHQSYYHSITSQLRAQIPRTRTNFTTVVRWYPGNPVTSLDLFADRMDIFTKGVNFSIRQAIPLPEFMGSSGRWEAIIDVRNIFAQGQDRIRTSDGDLFLTHNPRTLRFGLNLNFF